MATYVPPKKGVAWIGYIGLPSQGTPEIFQSNPTIAAGDFKVSIDGGALANLGTLPTVTPASGKMVKISLSTSETNGDNITVVCSDAAGAEWCDVLFNLQTTARQVDDLAYPATSGRSMVVDAAGLVDANTVKQGPTGSGTAQTARDMGASVLLSAGTGAGQLDFTSGVVKANLVQILATALTETAGQLAGGFKKLFDVTTPVFTLLSVNQTGDGFARLGAPAGASHAADVAAVKVDTAAVKVQTDKLAFTVANQIDANVLDWKSATAPAMTGDAFARLGAPAGASVSADVAAVKSDTATAVTQTGAAAIRADVGLASANLDTQLGTIAGYIDTEVGTIITNIAALPTANANADALLDRAAGVETGLTFRQAMRGFASVLLSKLSGAGTATEVFRDFGDTKDRISATVDASGNRTAITRDLT